MRKGNIKKMVNRSAIQKLQFFWNIVSILLIVGLLYAFFSKENQKSGQIKSKSEYKFGHLDTSFLGSDSIINGFDDRLERPRTSVLPKQGCVQTHEMAVKLALLYWEIDYADYIDSEKPFSTILYRDSVWHVSGTLPESYDGGTVYLEIQKKDGKVLNLTHYK